MKQPKKQCELVQRVAANVHRLRTRAKLTQQALADRAEISVSYVSMVERGDRSLSLDKLEDVAFALQVPPSTLLLKSAA